MTALVWFTRDLRVHDHPALHAALEAHDRVIPVFCFDDRLLHGRHASGPRTQFLLECLAELDTALQARGSGLVLRRGRPEDELARLAGEAGADTVFCTADDTPYARARALRVAERVKLRRKPGLHAVDDLAELRTGKGTPYAVFTPFYRAWLEQPRRTVLGAPETLPPLDIATGRLPSLEELGHRETVPEPPPGGETEARSRTARRGEQLSPYLHFGCITPRELENRTRDDEFRRQLAWRDFYHHVLQHHPGNARREYQARYRGMRWSRSRTAFDAWCAGRTGFPLVDAGMRQLLREGWMHNRVRLVVGSFLTKDLALDWRWGERWFMRWLVDGDQANNNGNWQWIASVGTDPQPAFRRIYNPARQQERFDPRGTYVRRYVPELAGVPDEHLAEPWLMSEAEQEASGCIIGRDYPEPIVDHALARREALERYGRAR